MRAALLAAAGAAAASAAIAGTAAAPRVVDCDIAIAGGSLASLSAALTAANATAARGGVVCYFEATDWPGGQATNGGTSAIDWGAVFAHFPLHVSPLLQDYTRNGMGAGDAPYPNMTNPGRCTVSDVS